MEVMDYISVAVGILGFILGVAQLISKRCIGILSIDQYTEKSAKKFAIISGILYVIGGIAIAVVPFVAKSIEFEVTLGVVAIVLIAQFTTLEKR